MTTNYFDIIIIGSGMAGLYSAYNIKKMSPETSFLILEKHLLFRLVTLIMKMRICMKPYITMVWMIIKADGLVFIFLGKIW